jgi:hypothetical protein
MPPEPDASVTAVRINNPDHANRGQRWNRMPHPRELGPVYSGFAGLWMVDRPVTSPPPQTLTWSRLIAYAGSVEACAPQWEEQGSDAPPALPE